MFSVLDENNGLNKKLCSLGQPARNQNITK